MAIHFFNEDIEQPNIDKRQIKAWVKAVVKAHDKSLGKLNYIFTSDTNIIKVNKTYLQHDYYTDVITFDYTYSDKIAGDIFISLDTVRSNAKKFNQAFSEELSRVIIHGVLHLIGFKDKSNEEAREMRLQEDKALEILQSLPS